MRQDLNGELSRMIWAGWCAFNSIKDVLKGKIDKTTRKNIFNSAVLPAMLYGSETWALTKREEQRLLVAERAIERAMLGISLLDRIPNEIIRERSSVKDIVVESRHNKMRWVGHTARLTDNRWTAIIAEWYPREQKRPPGRPPRRWEDDIVKRFRRTWRRKARVREEWQTCCDRRSLNDS
ncbi:hypothetical protein G0U57_015976 [Chelydra serpentina]|uniref:Endonuclease-reverse transcriptase n=1 Tax=Chelydra serpentina TaxID=8475 RepID=A0A8T1TIC3_CHESE|nr:hypothetical protein G0U57_015976 [Chelydra serpentina]